MKKPGWVPPFFPHSYQCYRYSCNSKGRQVLGIKREVCKSGRRKTITEDPGYTLGCMQGWTPGLPTSLGGQVHFYSSLWYCMKTVDHSGAHSGQTTYTCVRRCVGPSWLRVLRSTGGGALLDWTPSTEDLSLHFPAGSWCSIWLLGGCEGMCFGIWGWQ